MSIRTRLSSCEIPGKHQPGIPQQPPRMPFCLIPAILHYKTLITSLWITSPAACFPSSMRAKSSQLIPVPKPGVILLTHMSAGCSYSIWEGIVCLARRDAASRSRLAASRAISLSLLPSRFASVAESWARSAVVRVCPAN